MPNPRIIHNKQYIIDRVVEDPNTNCWIWNLSTNKRGYGYASQGKGISQPMFAHRLTYQIWNPTTFNPILYTLHKCDNPSCCNPEHLYQGTHQNNVDDKVNRGRQHKGNR